MRSGVLGGRVLPLTVLLLALGCGSIPVRVERADPRTVHLPVAPGIDAHSIIAPAASRGRAPAKASSATRARTSTASTPSWS
jgi:hypothetical protein